MMNLFGKTYEQFNNQDWFSYELSLMTSMPEMGGVSLLKCATPANCKVSYSRFYTPVLYYVQPSVLYAGAEVALWVDPRSAQEVVDYGTEWPFIEARVNGYTVDFEGKVDEMTYLSPY
jgi:hypothetical protein